MIRVCIGVLVAICCWLTMPGTAPAAAQHKQVLMITSYHHGDAWNDGIVQGVRDVLGGMAHVNLTIEHLDMRRNAGEQYQQWVSSFLGHKYRRIPQDLVIVSDDEALNFLFRVRDELFPRVPVVFTGINNFTPERIADQTNITGVNEEINIARNLELGLRLFPRTSHVFAVVDEHSAVGRANLGQYRAVAEQFASRVELGELLGLTGRDSPELLRALPRDSLVLRLNNLLDGRGGYLSVSESMHIIAQESPGPVLTFWSFDMGLGPLGGFLVSAREQGRSAGELAARILSGQHPNHLPVVMESPNLPMFDYQQMRRFGVKIADLPAEAVVINLPETFYSQHKTLIWTVAAVIAFLAMCIAALVGVLVVRRKDEERLRESEERFRVLFDQAPDPLFIWRLDDTLQDINNAACRLLGYDREELLRLPLSKIQAPNVRKRNGNIIQDELRHGAFESVDLRKDGTEVPVEIITVPIWLGGREYGLSAVRDITERKQAQQESEKLHSQLVQAQKMESVGILAGGIAHDFNNLLHAMRGNLELLAKAEALDAKGSERVRTVIKNLDRGANLVRQLLQFSRKVETRKVRVDLNQEVRDVFHLLERTIPKMIALELRLDPTVYPISGDPTQIEQVLLNLAGNAVDAMPHGGTLTIETRNVILDEQSETTHSALAPGHHVLLVVADTGVGMDEKTLKHVFDPFYTTKDVGKGTGLGLASAYGIVTAHGGMIQCSSEPGQGSTFRIFLQAHDTADPGANSRQMETITGSGTETILVVDDEPEILDLTREALEDFGYTVHTATKGEQALEVYRKHGQTIDLILLDLNMPGMGGHKCLQELLHLDPAARVLIASGYSANGQAESILSSGASGFLSKPFQLKELAAKVREVLDG
jgi:two-component system, sensor histidine kinase